MALWHNFPYSNLHDLNLDWFLETFKDFMEKVEDLNVTAEATEGESAGVVISGTVEDGIKFSFTLPRGPKGEDGLSFKVLGRYDTVEALLQAHPTGINGDAYAVGSIDDNYIYVWNGSANTWQNIGSLEGPQGPQGEKGDPQTPYDLAPQMDGVANPGSVTDYARGDHRHPSDTTKANVTELNNVALASQVRDSSLAGSLAPIELETAISAHAVGDLIVYDYQLCRVTQAIAVGNTLTIGTNIELVKVGETISLQTTLNGLSCYFKRNNNVVTIAITSGSTIKQYETNEALITIPLQFRPKEYFSFTESNGMWRYLIGPDGNLRRPDNPIAQDTPIRLTATFVI